MPGTNLKLAASASAIAPYTSTPMQSTIRMIAERRDFAMTCNLRARTIKSSSATYYVGASQ
jgi:hypothetical protein